MTALPATSETRLPRAIEQMNERLRAKYETKAAPAEQPATPAAEAPAAVEQPQGDPRESDPAYWRQRFKVTEGVLKAEREKAQTAISALRQQISELQEQVRQAAKPSEEKIDLTAYFTPDQIEQFGEEHCQAMAEAAQRASKKQVQEALEPMKARHKAEEQDATEKRQRDYFDALAAEVPDYLEIDQSDGWRAWLAQEDPATGLVRQDVLTQHHTAHNAAKVASMFKKYLKESKPKPPEPTITPHGSATNAGGPQTSQAPAQGAPSRAEIKDYYKRASLGKVSDAERTSFEARLAAMHGA